MDTLRAAYRDDDDDSDLANHVSTITTTDALTNQGQPTTTDAVDDSAFDPADATDTETPETETEPVNGTKEEHIGFDDLSDDEISDDAENLHFKKLQKDEKGPNGSPQFTKVSETEEDDDEEPSPKKRKQLSTLTLSKHPKSEEQSPQGVAVVTKSIRTTTSSSKKSKKKNNNVWTKSTSRKGKKKTKNNNHNTQTEDKVLITPIPRFPDKNDDSPDMKICLSKFYKAEKVEISEDRLSAGSTKGYRMVRATRGVVEGPWYFEIKVVKLGETGHTRLGWSTDKGDLQAPVGYDGHSFGYRDIDGNKIHKALREKYGEEGYREGDVIGFYINLPEGSLYVPKPPRLVWYKGQRYVCALDAKEDPPKVVPGSEISFFKNGVCQGVAFKDLFGGRYYPAASMYTLPNQPNCVVSFNFGPDFEFFPEDFGDRPLPAPMIDVSYHGYDGGIVENGVSNEKTQ